MTDQERVHAPTEAEADANQPETKEEEPTENELSSTSSTISLQPSPRLRASRIKTVQLCALR